MTGHSRNDPEFGIVDLREADWAMFVDLFLEFNNGEAMIVRHSGVLLHNTVRFIFLDPDKAVSKLRQACEAANYFRPFFILGGLSFRFTLQELTDQHKVGEGALTQAPLALSN